MFLLLIFFCSCFFSVSTKAQQTVGLIPEAGELGPGSEHINADHAGKNLDETDLSGSYIESSDFSESSLQL